MKKLKKFVSLLAIAALLVLIPSQNALTASAAEPVTYYLRFIDGEWRQQQTAVWDDKAAHRELYYMNEAIKDGDIIIVEGSSTTPITVDVKLSNLTVKNGSSVVFHAKGYDECYILDQNTAAINGDVTNAHVYGSSKCNFNNNVSRLEIIGMGNDLNNLHATVTTVGTVSHLAAIELTGEVYFEYYDFPANTFRMEDGSLRTEEKNYSKTPSAQQNAAQQNNTQQNAAQPPAQNQNTSSDEYDDVPKTGESNLIFWLIGIAAVGIAGKYALNKAR